MTTPEEVRTEGLPQPDVVITDYLMPGMDGVEVIRTVRQRWPEAKVILISGKMVNSESWPSERRPDVFLEKPFTSATLTEEVKRLLGS